MMLECELDDKDPLHLVVKDMPMMRRNDREEIRRRLAMGAEDDYIKGLTDKPLKKPSLQSRLQNGKNANLQICFMNETASDSESPGSDSDTCPKLSAKTPSSYSQVYHRKKVNMNANPYSSRPLTFSKKPSGACFGVNSKARPASLNLGPAQNGDEEEPDFFTKQARLQIEARMALSQAKDMAHMQMEIEKKNQKVSPITELIRGSLQKVGADCPHEKRRMSRQMLTNMNIAQLQVIVNDLHTHIEKWNGQLVDFLMERDELHMGQDSMLVDIEDLTRYLGAKEQSKLQENYPKSYSRSSTPGYRNTTSSVMLQNYRHSMPVGMLDQRQPNKTLMIGKK